MDNGSTEETGKSLRKTKNLNGWQIFGIVAGAILVSTLLSAWIIKTYIFPTEFKPVTLTQKEQLILNRKLERIPGGDSFSRGGKAIKPERYSEKGAGREIVFTEREINSLLANNTDLASKMAIDLSDDLASAVLLLPMDPEFPVIGGKTLKISAGVELAYKAGKPVVILRGVSLWGVPLPNAWIGNLKNVDLVAEFGGNRGFWKSFADGVEHIEVKEGKLHLKLKE